MPFRTKESNIDPSHLQGTSYRILLDCPVQSCEDVAGLKVVGVAATGSPHCTAGEKVRLRAGAGENISTLIPVYRGMQRTVVVCPD